MTTQELAVKIRCLKLDAAELASVLSNIEEELENKLYDEGLANYNLKR